MMNWKVQVDLVCSIQLQSACMFSYVD